MVSPFENMPDNCPKGDRRLSIQSITTPIMAATAIWEYKSRIGAADHAPISMPSQRGRNHVQIFPPSTSVEAVTNVILSLTWRAEVRTFNSK